MMTQSVMTQAANLFANATGSVTLKGKQTGSGFDQIINTNLKALQSTPGTAATAKKTSAPKTDGSTAGQSDETGSAADRTETLQDKAAAAVKDTNSAKQTDAAQPDDNVTPQKAEAAKPEEEEEPVIDEQLLSQILGMLQAVSDAVMDKLKLSPEEFQQLLTSQGMTAADLLDPANLQKLVLAKNGETNLVAVLTNEDLAGTMNDLLKQVQDMKENAGINLNLEQIKEILAKAEEMKILPAKEAPVQPADTGKQDTAEVKPEKQQEAVTPVTAKNDEASKDTDKPAAETTAAADTAKTQVSGEGSRGSQTDTGKKGSRDMKAPDQFQSFIDNLVKVSKDTQAAFGGNLVQVTQLREIANQIIDRIRISVTPDQSSMELQLNPENLGKVNLTVQSKSGVMTAQFVVQNEISKEAIESQLSTLKETLNQQGIKVEAIEVTVSSNAFDQEARENSQNQADTKESNNGRQITLEDALNMTETPEEEGTLQDISDTVGGQIDYTA